MKAGGRAGRLEDGKTEDSFFNGRVITTKLEKELRREIAIDGEPYVRTIGPEGLKLTPKGKRKGQELSWKALMSGGAALAAALNASLKEARGR